VEADSKVKREISQSYGETWQDDWHLRLQTGGWTGPLRRGRPPTRTGGQPRRVLRFG